jgi:hypothetical protein
MKKSAYDFIRIARAGGFCLTAVPLLPNLFQPRREAMQG